MIIGHTISRIPGDQTHNRVTVEDHEGSLRAFIIERSRLCDAPWLGDWPNGVHSDASDFGLILTGHRIPHIEVKTPTLDLPEIQQPSGAGVAA